MFIAVLGERGMPSAMYGNAPQLYGNDLRKLYQHYGLLALPRTVFLSLALLTSFVAIFIAIVEIASIVKATSLFFIGVTLVNSVIDVFRLRKS
jgi:hypothetical protein